MKTIILSSIFMFSTALAWAEGIGDFIQKEAPQSKRFHCAYQQRNAAQTCIVSLHQVTANHSKTLQYFGSSPHTLLKIQWPDGNTSRYALMKNHELFNLSNEQNYQFKTLKQDPSRLDLTEGLIILNGHNELVRMW